MYIAAGSAVSATQVTTFVDALAADGLVRRRAHADDRRGTLIELTAKARRTPDDDWKTHIAEVGELFAVLSPDERAQLLETLGKLLAEIERRDPASPG